MVSEQLQIRKILIALSFHVVKMKAIFSVIIQTIFISLSIFNAVNCMPSRSRGNSKPTCSKPSKEGLKDLLLQSQSSDITVIDYHFSCLAVRAFDLFDSLAVIVKYNTTTTTAAAAADDDDLLVVQIAAECNDNFQWILTETVRNRDDHNIFDALLPTEYRCYKCVSTKPSRGPGSENHWNESTWCLGMCQPVTCTCSIIIAKLITIKLKDVHSILFFIIMLCCLIFDYKLYMAKFTL